MSRRCVLARILFALLCSVFLYGTVIGIFFVTASSNPVYAFTGDGTTVAPYHISNADDLKQLSDDVNNGLYDGYYGVTFTLTDNISIADICASTDGGWVPIGTASYPFKGTFDGAGYSVTGLSVDREDTERVGLFGMININATVKNLTVSGSVNGGSYTAGIVGYNQGLIENCTNEVTVTAKNESLHIGGVTGYNIGVIESSNNTANINVGFAIFTGGIAGSNLGTIENCGNTADIFSTGSMVGGIAGNNATGGNISVCLNSGIVAGKSTIGGIAGNNQGTVQNVFNSGLIDSVNGTAGGIIGGNESVGAVSYALTVGNVNGLEDTAAVCGYNLGVVSNVFYDSSVYSGSILNGLSAERSAGLSTRVLTHGDVLTDEIKLALLVDGNAGTWTKRAAGTDAYYPELKYFHDNLPDMSKEASRAERVTLTASDITLSRMSFVYDGNPHEVDIYFGTVLLENGQDYTAMYLNNTEAGTAKIEITLLNNFAGTLIKEFTVTQSPLTVVWDISEFIYNGEKQSPVLRITDGLINSEDATFVYTTDESITAGTHTVSAVLANTAVNANYYLPPTSTQYQIARKDITVSWSSDDFVYSGEVQLPVASVATGKIGEDDITFCYEFTENIRAGEQTVTAYLADSAINGNYSFVGDEHSYQIEKKPITVVWSDATEQFYYNGLVQFPTATVSEGRIGTDEITFVYSGYENNIGANETDGHFVLLSLADTAVNANYYFETESHNYKILKTPVNIEWWGMPLTYSGFPQYPGFYISSGGIGDDDITFDVSDYSKNINARPDGYQIEITLSDTAVNANYGFQKTIKTYGIEKAKFDLNSSLEFRSETFAYDGTGKNIFVGGTLPSGLTVMYENNGQIEIGEHIVTARFVVDYANYLPLEPDFLTTTMYIARMAFDDLKSGIAAINKGDAVHGLELKVDEIYEPRDFDRLGKKLLKSYGVTLTNGAVEISVPLSEQELKEKGLTVLYKNSSGEILTANFEIVNGKLVFSAEDITEFVVMSDSHLWLIWVGIGVFIFLIAVVCLMLVLRNRRIKRIETIITDSMRTEYENAERRIDASGVTFTKNDGVWRSVVYYVKDKNPKTQKLSQRRYERVVSGMKKKSYKKEKRNNEK